MQGGGGTDPSLSVGAFEPGAPLGVQLVRGDLSVTGIGTLTHRVGDKIVGFGHPLLFGRSHGDVYDRSIYSRSDFQPDAFV